MARAARADLTDAELARLNQQLEGEPASAIVAWAVARFGDRLCLAASMQDAVLIDIAVGIDPEVEVVFIDTGYHFPETLDTVERIRDRHGLNLRVMRPDVPPDPPLWQVDPVNCCSGLRVALLDAALAGKEAWMTGLRRAEAPTRADVPVVGRDRRGLVKVNPLATWSAVDVTGYIADHDVIVNPLMQRGYLSIGCAPCTEPVAPGDDSRSGRWAGLDKTECGLHE